MIKLLSLALSFALAATCAHAASYVLAQGQSSDFTGATVYTQYLESSNTPVFGQKEITTEVHAAFGSSAAYGLLKANAEIDALPLGGVLYGLAPSVGAAATFEDWITVGGVGPITLHFTMPTEGFFDPNSQYASVSSTFDAVARNSSGGISAEAYCAYQARVQSGNQFLDSSILFSDITVDPGTRISLSGYLVTSAQLYYLNPTFLKSEADFSHTAHSYIDVLTPGGSIVADSGQNYSSTVPEPTSLAFLGIGAVLLLRRRRTNRCSCAL